MTTPPVQPLISPKPLLDRVKTPKDLKKIKAKDLPQLADELRRETIEAVSVTGGHLGAGLGVVELTVALHWVFDTPNDRLIWDVGHQCYPHKILTGRRIAFAQSGKAAGYRASRSEQKASMTRSVPRNSSTSISAGLAWLLPAASRAARTTSLP